MNTAFRYIKDNNGVDGESCYPYRARVSYTMLKASLSIVFDYNLQVVRLTPRRSGHITFYTCSYWTNRVDWPETEYKPN